MVGVGLAEDRTGRSVSASMPRWRLARLRAAWSWVRVSRVAGSEVGASLRTSWASERRRPFRSGKLLAVPSGVLLGAGEDSTGAAQFAVGPGNHVQPTLRQQSLLLLAGLDSRELSRCPARHLDRDHAHDQENPPAEAGNRILAKRNGTDRNGGSGHHRHPEAARFLEPGPSPLSATGRPSAKPLMSSLESCNGSDSSGTCSLSPNHRPAARVGGGPPVTTGHGSTAPLMARRETGGPAAVRSGQRNTRQEQRPP
ncbi:hypothetical protein RKD31_000724 [Streptomyces sp. SAI-163]